jgi:hypothetical protein
MALRYQAANDAMASTAGPSDRAGQGRVVLRLAGQGVGRFVRLDDGRPLADYVARMYQRICHAATKFATNVFFFQEGRYFPLQQCAVWRVPRRGFRRAILVTLLDENLLPP